jgi:hypothetical protein
MCAGWAQPRQAEFEKKVGTGSLLIEKGLSRAWGNFGEML